MAEFAYHFYDLASNAFLDTLPMENTGFSREISGIGQFSGDIPMGAEQLDSLRVLGVVRPYQTKIFVERGDSLVWGGWLHEDFSYDSSSRRLSVTAEETLGSFASRNIPSFEHYGADKFVIARWLLSTAQAEEGGNMRLVLGSEMSGVTTDQAYSAPEQSKVLDSLAQLAEDDFEYATEVSWSGVQAPQEQLVLAYPRLGRVRQQSGMVLEYDAFSSDGGNVISYQRPSGTGFATVVHARVTTEEGVPLQATATANSLLAHGYPRIERTEEYEGIFAQAPLQAKADALLKSASGPRSAWTFTVRAREGSEMGDWQLGDDMLVRITDHLYPPGPNGGAGYVGYQRLAAYDVKPGPEGLETYTFTMSERINPF